MTPKKDLTGQRFGYLTVTERAPDKQAGGKIHTAWRCRCDCGSEIVVTTSGLKAYDVITCGRCGSFRGGPNVSIGQRFGKLTVMRKYSQMHHGSQTWICRCDCGMEVAYSTKELKYGGITDCGVCSEGMK